MVILTLFHHLFHMHLFHMIKLLLLRTIQLQLRTTRFELATFGFGIQRATVAPRLHSRKWQMPISRMTRFFLTGDLLLCKYMRTNAGLYQRNSVSCTPGVGKTPQPFSAAWAHRRPSGGTGGDILCPGIPRYCPPRLPILIRAPQSPSKPKGRA